MSDNLFQERLRELEDAQHELSEVRVGSNTLQRAGAKAIAASKKAAKERDLAAAAEPKDKITHKDVLVKRGVLKAEGVEIEEKTLTPAELKKREEVAKAMERDKPGMDKSKKMAIATAVAKRVAEAEQIDELSKSTLTSYRDAAKERRKEHNSAIQRASSIKDTMGDENGILDKAISYHSKEHDRLGGKMKIAARKIKKIKEDVEQVSELSKTTLAAYYAKSISDRHSKDLARDSAKRKGDEKEADVLGRKVTNRSSGLEKAKAKFFKEDADPTN